ncbi:MAG: RsmB/NOP family class I SAM-dependent RNA methyltransferase [Nanoarchaeota archaeon]
MNFFLNRYKQLGADFDPETIEIRPSLRVNTLKIQEEEIVKRLKKEGVKLEKIPFLEWGYWYEAEFSMGATPEYLIGYYYLQEAASQLPVKVLNPKPGETVLDMAAAPGSKTTQIGQYMKNKGVIMALDENVHRLVSVRNNLERCGVTNSIIYKKDARFIPDFKMKFDKILLDAPCSGNFITDKDWFGKKTIDGIKERARLQKELLKAAVKVLKKDGVLVYSTCTLEPEENEMNIDWLLKKYPELKLEKVELEIGDPGLTEVFGEKLNPELSKCRRLWPHKTQTEGFFIAKIVWRAK